MIRSLAICLVLTGCKFAEPPPAEAVYLEAVAESAKRPGLDQRTKPVAVAAPKTAPKKGGADVPSVAPAQPTGIRPELKDGQGQVMDLPGGEHLMCVDHPRALDDLGSLVRAAGDKATSVGSAPDQDSGVVLENQGTSWRVCVVLKTPAPGSRTLAARRVARLWHRAAYSGLESRKPELLRWLRDEHPDAAPSLSAPTRLWLLVDPESVKSESQLLSALELELQ